MMTRVPETSLTIADDDHGDDDADDADHGIDVSLGAGLYLAGVLEYLIAEILHQAVAQQLHKSNRINPHQILQVICNDPELTELFPDYRLLDFRLLDFRLLNAKTSPEATTSQPDVWSEELWQHGGDSQYSDVHIKKKRQLSHVDAPHVDAPHDDAPRDDAPRDDALGVRQVLLEHLQLQEEICSIYPGVKQRLISKDIFKLAIENKTSWKGTRKRGLQETFVQCMLFVRRGTSQIPNAVTSLVDTFGVHVREFLALLESYLF